MSRRSTWPRKLLCSALAVCVLVTWSALGAFGTHDAPAAPGDAAGALLAVMEQAAPPAAPAEAAAPAPTAVPAEDAATESLRDVSRLPRPRAPVPETPQLAYPVTTSWYDGVAYVRLYVPYLNQLFDTENDFDGECACGPASLAMVLAYFGRVGARDLPVGAPFPHISAYGWAITYSTYNYGNRVFNRQIGECGDGDGIFGGLYGALMASNQWTLTEWSRLEATLTAHNLSFTSYDGTWATADIVRAAIDQGRPVIMSQRGLTGAGHLIVITGYTNNGWFLVNDSWGYKWAGYPNYGGAMVPYTWKNFGTIGRAWVVGGAGEGWRGEYFDSYGTLFGRYDRDINFNWGEQGPGAPFEAYSFTARWTRVVTLPAGKHVLSMTGDGEARVSVDGKPVLDQLDAGAGTGVKTDTATLDLPAGQHEFVVTYRHNPGDPAVARFGLSRE